MRIAVSDIDSHRYYLASDMPFDDYVERLAGVSDLSDRGKVSIDFADWMHHLWAGAAPPSWLTRFGVSTEVQLPRPTDMMFGVNRSLRVETEVGPIDVDVRGRVHSRDAGGIAAYKCGTASQTSFEKYVTSAQWRVLLWITGCDRFRYDIFRLSRPRHREDRLKFDYLIDDHAPLELRRYDSLDAEVESEISDYVRFLLEIGEKAA